MPSKAAEFRTAPHSELLQEFDKRLLVLAAQLPKPQNYLA
jgi:hypothetical protein